jgi:hypothetical protein
MAHRSALPLPRYVLRKISTAGVRFYFNIPAWARAQGCPLHNEPLGSDYGEAVQRAETVLLPQFDAWRSGTDAPVREIAKAGTLDWLFAEYRADRRFTRLHVRTRRGHESGLNLVGNYVLKDGRKLGTMSLTAITTSVVDALLEKLLTITKTDAAGNVVIRERRTTVNDAMRSCRRAWNVAFRRNPGKVPLVNPFARMGLKSSGRVTPTATYAELTVFRAKAIELGHPSLATGALVGWEWLQRAKDIFATFDVTHYRPKERPNAVRVVHSKTDEENWIPLFDDKGVPLFPELMAELDAIKRERIGGLMLTRDWGDHRPWPTWATADDPDLGYLTQKVREIIRAADLRKELSFTSFRHGGFTEGADADLSDAELRAQGRHKSAKVLPRYAKRTMRQVAEAARKRRAARTKADDLSESASPSLSERRKRDDASA